MNINLHCQWTRQLTIVGAISWAAADHWFVHFRSSLICAAEDSVPVSHRGPGPLVVSCGRSPVPLFMMQILCRKCVCAVPSLQYRPSRCLWYNQNRRNKQSVPTVQMLFQLSISMLGSETASPAAPFCAGRGPADCPLSTQWKRFLRLIFVELLWTKQTWWSGNKYPWFSTLVLLWCRHREKSLNYVRRNSCLVTSQVVRQVLGLIWTIYWLSLFMFQTSCPVSINS